MEMLLGYPFQMIELYSNINCPRSKGDRQSAGRKSATLENGLEKYKSLLHLEEGAKVRVNTMTGDIA